MGKWFDTNPNEVIDARLAYEGAGAMGRGLKGIGDAVSGYAKLKYKKQRDVKDDANKANDNSTKIKTHEIDYKRSIDTAGINAGGKVKVATINGSTDRDVVKVKKEIAKIDYKRSTDTAGINAGGKVKVATINGSTDRDVVKVKKDIAKIDYKRSTDTAGINYRAKIGSAKIGASAKNKATSVSAANNKRTNLANTTNTNTKAKATRYRADKSVEASKIKNKNSETSYLGKALKNAKTSKEITAILKAEKELQKGI